MVVMSVRRHSQGILLFFATLSVHRTVITPGLSKVLVPVEGFSRRIRKRVGRGKFSVS